MKMKIEPIYIFVKTGPQQLYFAKFINFPRFSKTTNEIKVDIFSDIFNVLQYL